MQKSNDRIWEKTNEIVLLTPLFEMVVVVVVVVVVINSPKSMISNQFESSSNSESTCRNIKRASYTIDHSQWWATSSVAVFRELNVHVNHTATWSFRWSSKWAGEPRVIPHCSVPVLFQIDKAAQFAAVRTPLRLPHGVANALPFSLTRYAAAVVATRERQAFGTPRMWQPDRTLRLRSSEFGRRRI
jgi:hypothetical protein